MFRLEYIGILRIILIYIVSFAVCQDRIILSDPNFDETQTNYSLGNITRIPETLLIQLKDVRNVSDLLERFVAFDADDSRPVLGPSRTNGTGSSRRGLSAVAAATIAQPANCQTKDHIVELDQPENGATIYWPSCVRVKRCGGCCTSKMLTCKPLATSVLNVTVLQMYYNHENPGSFESQGTRVFSLEQHNRCACTCKEGPEDCDPSVHDYKSNECRCACKNSELSASCTGSKKIWDTRSCICKCRNNRLCSSGRYFNILTCRCEILRRSLATDLSMQNSSITLTLQGSEVSP